MLRAQDTECFPFQTHGPGGEGASQRTTGRKSSSLENLGCGEGLGNNAVFVMTNLNPEAEGEWLLKVLLSVAAPAQGLCCCVLCHPNTILPSKPRDSALLGGVSENQCL